ncbi:sugar ABC transporter ATP-binding protein [Rhodococcus aetherivorans]|uniref:sugar ABC transporter ATP-binding protein n=1 Tax=Rhodococcus aetherivorans TaxID=191292 RepID=UPI0036C2F498
MVTATHVSDRPSALRLTGLAKSFGATTALEPFDLEIAQGEIHALVGENGSGKSTFIKILAGYHVPDGGDVQVAGHALELGSPESAHRLGIRFVHQDLGLINDLSVEDNLYLTNGFPTRLGTVSAKKARAGAQQALSRLDLAVDPSAKVETLSPAQRTGVAVARALYPDPTAPVRVIVMDEPTATLPQEEVVHLLSLVKSVASTGVGVIFVTHRLDELFGFADRITVLRDGVKQATRSVAELTRREIVNLMVGTEFDEAHAEATNLPHFERTQVLSVSHLKSVPLRDVSFTVAAGEVLGVAGLTGSGREILLSAVFGGCPRDGGDAHVGSDRLPAGRPDLAVQLGVGYVPPDRKLNGALLDLTARENLVLPRLRPFWKFPRLHKSAESNEVRRWFEKLDIRPREGLTRPLATFSGGNQQKVVLAKWLRLDPRLLLLDEPTQGVDVGAKATIYHHLLEAAGTGTAIAVASSDSDELAAICNRVIVLRDGRIVAELVGDAVTAKNISAEALGRNHADFDGAPDTFVAQA